MAPSTGHKETFLQQLGGTLSLQNILARYTGLKELSISQRRKLRPGNKEAEPRPTRPPSRQHRIRTSRPPGRLRWVASARPDPSRCPGNGPARASALLSLARSSASTLVTFFFNKNPRRRDTASDLTCRRRTPLRPLSALGRGSLRRPAACALLPDSKLETASRAPRRAPPPPHPHPNPQPGSPAARVSMATLPPRRKKKPRALLGPLPRRPRRRGAPLMLRFLFLFF